jgi:hypothetical protein
MPPEELKTLEEIKRLLVLLLLKLDTHSDEIALALEIKPRTARALIPSRKVKKIIRSEEN